ncbi:MAG: DUF4097 domain-containing protein [Firmicutes bacterium]|nr:DUF4097 domain-containing protein [Bacillota bacterium]
MKATRIFFGIVVVIIGALWLLSNFNLITVSTLLELWRYWPLLLILWGLLLLLHKDSTERAGWWGLFFLVGVVILIVIMGFVFMFSPWFSHFSRRGRHVRTIDTAIENIYAAERMRLELKLQTGELLLSAHNGEPLVAMQIQAVEEPKITHRQYGKLAEIFVEDQELKLENQVSRWHFSLPKNVPAEIICHIGATDANLDLTELPVEKFEMHTGAGDLTVKLPQINSEIDIHTGAANVLIYIPQNVGVRLKADGALLNVDGKNSVISLGDRRYESKDLEGKEAIVDINVAAAAGSITLRSN